MFLISTSCYPSISSQIQLGSTVKGESNAWGTKITIFDQYLALSQK